MSVTRVQSGLIFDDSFETLDSRWVVSPSDSFTYSEVDKRLSITHNPTDRSTNAMFSLPSNEEELLLQIHADYTPSLLGDEGGLVIWKNALEKVEFLESEDSIQAGDYSVWRATKKNNLWTFFAEKNNAWELFDSTVCVDPVMAGAVLKGVPLDGYVPLALDRVILCRGTSISLGNISSNYKVELLDETMQVVSTQVVPEGFSGIQVELPSVPFTGKLRIYDTDGNGGYVQLDEQKDFAVMYGGDLFLLGTDLKVMWKGTELSEINPTSLGSMKNDSIEEKMTLLNATTGNVAEGIQIKIAVYSQEFGWEWCDLANDVNGAPGTYDDTTIQMGTLSEGESKDFWVKIVKQDVSSNEDLKEKMRPTHFYLQITND